MKRRCSVLTGNLEEGSNPTGTGKKSSTSNDAGRRSSRHSLFLRAAAHRWQSSHRCCSCSRCLGARVMSDGARPVECPPRNSRCESSEDDERKQKRREKNRVAAQRSRKKQTQRADKLHEEYEYLEQENLLLRKEVQMLTEEQKSLTEALKAHEPLCPIMHCSVNLTSHSRLQVLAGGLLR
ncbi:basic leucine zipper transcriptional factor ATF-like 3-like [Arapaima gigas]